MIEKSLDVFRSLRTEDFTINVPVSKLLGGNNTVIMADPRKGKSYTAAKICEQLCQIGVPFIIVDPEGEYYSLREKFAVLVAGLEKEENCDVTVNIEHAGVLADQFISSKIPVIFDVSSPDLDEEVQHEFLADFMKALIGGTASRERVPCLVIIDEADEFIPERGHKPRGVDYNQFTKLVKKGGKRGIGSIIISHRPTWVAKDLLAKCQNWILMHQAYKPDLERIEDITRLEMRMLYQLKGLHEGEALIYGPITEDKPVWVKCLPRETTHIGTTPDVKPRFVERPELTNLLKSLNEQIAHLTRRRTTIRSEADRLQQENRDLRSQLETITKDLEAYKTAKIAAGMINVQGEGGPIPISDNGAVDKLQKSLGEANVRIKELEGQVTNLRIDLESAQKQVHIPTIPFHIDDYGTIKSDFLWLQRLINMNRTTAIIIKYLMENSWTTADILALRCGFHIETIRGRINELMKKGVVIKSNFKPFKYKLRES